MFRNQTILNSEVSKPIMKPDDNISKPIMKLKYNKYKYIYMPINMPIFHYLETIKSKTLEIMKVYNKYCIKLEK